MQVQPGGKLTIVSEGDPRDRPATTTTPGDVIRREITQKPGALYNFKRMEETRRVINLNLL
jgi:outer membrane protein assembly factor BamA